MEDKIIDIIYDKIKDSDFYNYDNDKALKDIEIEEITNILQEKVIQIKIDNRYYTINCVESFRWCEK